MNSSVQLFSGFCHSNFWEDEISWNVDIPVFSTCLQCTILVWIPAAIFLIFLPLEAYRLNKVRYIVVKWNLLNITRFTSGICLVVLNLGWLCTAVYYRLSGRDVSPAQLSGAVIFTLALISSLFLLIFQKKRGVLYSPCQFWFWCFSAIAESIKFYSVVSQHLYKASEPVLLWTIITIATFSLTILSFLLQFLSDKIDPMYTRNMDSNNTGFRLATSSYPSQLIFGWILPVIYKGYKHGMKRDDVWTVRPSHRTSDTHQKFMLQWKKLKEDCNRHNYIHPEKKRDPTMATALSKAFWPQFTCGVILRLGSDMGQFISPIFLNLLLSFMSSEEPGWHGILYAVCLFIFTFMQECFLTHSSNVLNCLTVRIKGALSLALYQKGLLLSSSARQEFSVGEMVNLVSVDIQKFHDFFIFFPHLFVSPFTIVVGVYLLWNLLGPSCLAGVAVILCLSPANYFIAKYIGKLQDNIMKLSDERLKVTNEVINGMKVLKLYAWENPFIEAISNIRKKETKNIKYYSYTVASIEMGWELGTVSVCFASLVVFAYTSGQILTPNIAFVSLSLFNIVKVPMMNFPTALNSIIEIMISIKRMDKMLNAEELTCKATEADETDDPISVENGDFTWTSQDEAAVLKDLTFSLEEGKLTAVVGRVASGKSSIISALLGEMNQTKGILKKRGTIAYVPQQAWIQNFTIRKNITFSSSFDREKYDKVIHACALIEDLNDMPAGDSTEIGERGINISGGQKQRVSLARAVYNDSDIYMMDDPLSAVDAHVGRHLFKNVIGPEGVLNKKTRLLATNNLTFLPQCDKIIALENGQISEMGTFSELMKNSKKFADLVQNYIPNVQDKESDVEEDIIEEHANEEASEKDALLRRSLSRSYHRSVSKLETEQKKKSLITLGQLVEEEEMETGSVKFSTYWSYLQQVGFKVTAIIALSYVLFTALDVVAKFWLSAWSNDSLDPNYNGDMLDFRVGVYAAFGFSSSFSLLLGLLFYGYGHVRTCVNLHRFMLKSIFHSPMSFFDTTPVGRIMNRFSGDINTMDYTLQDNIRLFVIFIFMIIGAFVSISIQTPVIILLFIPMLIVYVLLQRGYLKTSRQLRRIEAVTKSPICSQFSESISGASSIRAYGCTERFLREFELKMDEHLSAYHVGWLTTRWLEIAVLFIGAQVVFYAALLSVIYKEQMDPGSAGLSITYALNIIFQLNFSVVLASQIETNMVSVERILEYSKLSSEAPYVIPEKRPERSWPEEGEIVFRNYETRYRPELELVLKGLNLHVFPGEKIGICGRTGAGKSSLTLALFRIIEASSGSILLDGQDISAIGLHDLRSKLTIIPQDPVLFIGSLRFNLDPLNIKSDNEIWSALSLSHLKDQISSLDGGLEFHVSEGGDNLSVGQRQLLCLTRALLRKTKVLVLDEATAAVDPHTDQLIQETIKKEFSDCTIVTIAHRLNTIMDSSRIAVVDSGLIKEFDSPSVLLENKESILSKMVQDAASHNK